ncbi:F-box protein At5g07610 [Coffea arabica]|uniref:F-box protein At5g07610 n=1 Tax=Coffea arabica TaxID=13443 RepID=A0A6P6VQ35_COFAR|nr:F-box protein At5g07610 [Coffea arabica]
MEISSVKISGAAEQVTSARIVASIDELLEDILLRLPIRSLIRFKFVSKRWLSLISNPQFAVLHQDRNPALKPAIGLFLPYTSFRSNPTKFEYINFDVHNLTSSPFSVLKFASDPSAGSIKILQSCNGLLLCSSYRAQRPRQNYHVFNPTTKQLTTIPKPAYRRTIYGVSLAFDPTKSSAYKVVCVRASELVSGSYQIQIYSSDTAGPWRVSGEPFAAKHDFKNGIYWNGAVHWLGHWGRDNSLYFNVDEERLGEVGPTPNNAEQEAEMTYFGESCDHLNLIQMYGRPDVEFYVYEMRRDCSGWDIKYMVDLSAVTSAFPRMIRTELDSYDGGYYVLSVLSIIRGEKEEEAFLVLQIPGKAIRYNLVTKTFVKLCDFEGAEDEGYLRFEGVNAYQYIESLCCV